MSKFIKIISITLLFLSSIIYAQERGSLSVFSMHDEIPLKNTQVTIDGIDNYRTDRDGFVQVELSIGVHKVEIFAKDNDGKNLGYSKKPVTIKPKRDTQVIASFISEDVIPQVKIDTPVGTLEKEVSYANNGTGILNGTVLTSDNTKPIVNARVFVKGTSTDVRTDKDGKFSVEIPADVNMSISVVHSEYSAQTIDNILVKKDKTTSTKIELTPASLELEEFIVLAPKATGSIASIMEEEKDSSAITNIIGSAEISKKGDSSAAGALKRVTGVTLVDGKDIYVRGLGGRYSNIEMNSMPLPSPDPQNRSVPLDIFPADVIGSMKVQKSATADIPASFGGGYIDIRTKDKAKENYLKVSTEIKSNSNTGKRVNNYEGSATDWQGSDDGYRAIPSQILDASKIVIGQPVPDFDPANNQEYATNITNRLFTTTKEKLPYGGKLSLEGAYNIEITDKHKISLFANYSYGQDHVSKEEEYFSYNYQQATGSLYTTPNQYGNVYTTLDRYSNAGIFNISYNYADTFNLKFTKLYSKISDKVTKVSDGLSGSNDDWRIRYDLNWEERTLDVNQLNGDFTYEISNLENFFSFGLENAIADLNQPGNSTYVYTQDIKLGGGFMGDPYLDRFAPNTLLNLTTHDDLTAFYIKNKTMLNVFNEDEYLEIGISNSSKTRESRYNKYLINQNSSTGKLTDDIDTIYDKHIRENYDGNFVTSISFQPAYWYDAKVDESAYFANIFLKPTNNIEVLIGARGVDFEQTIFQYTNHNDALAPIEKIPESLVFNEILPSLGLKYKFDQKNQITFAYSQTYIVPDLREFASTEYFHPYDDATVKGNPNLINTDIFNYDLKYSHYFSNTENINLGLFYKNLDNPIEDTVDTRNALPLYSYENMDSAILYGVEIDGRKSLDLIHKSLRNYYASGNFSYTKSDVTLSQEQEEEFTNNHRELQGLSPTVVNLSLGYEQRGRNITFSYNKMGERIRKVGMIDGKNKYPDYYEVPPAVLDFVWIEGFDNGLTLKLKLKNLLDEETIWYQGSKENITNRFKVGRFYSFSVSYKY